MFYKITVEQATRFKADATLALTATTIPTAWLADIDTGLRILLSLAGIIAAVASTLYYHSARQKLK